MSFEKISDLLVCVWHLLHVAYGLRNQWQRVTNAQPDHDPHSRSHTSTTPRSYFFFTRPLWRCS